jgi:hypothetical protein
VNLAVVVLFVALNHPVKKRIEIKEIENDEN